LCAFSQIAYIINLKDKTCQNKTITYPFRPFGIPTNASFVDEYYIGSSAIEGSAARASALAVR
jgi:hypothetical protein